MSTSTSILSPTNSNGYVQTVDMNQSYNATGSLNVSVTDLPSIQNVSVQASGVYTQALNQDASGNIGVNIQNGSSTVMTTTYQTSTNGTAFASGTYTSTKIQADQSNTGYRGINAYLNVSAYTDSSITLEMDGKDPVSGTYYTLLAGTVVNSTGFHRYTVYPALTSSPTVANDVLPATWRIKVMVNSATSGATWSVGYDLVR